LVARTHGVDSADLRDNRIVLAWATKF